MKFIHVNTSELARLPRLVGINSTIAANSELFSKFGVKGHEDV